MGKQYTQPEEASILNDDGGEAAYWQQQEDAQLQEALQKTHTERFRIMIQLMKRGIMLSNAKITTQKV
jgi:hypothetical protein